MNKHMKSDATCHIPCTQELHEYHADFGIVRRRVRVDCDTPDSDGLRLCRRVFGVISLHENLGQFGLVT